MAENKKGRNQGSYYWTRGQLIALAMAFTATSVAVFLLGVFIGQGIEERKLLKKEEPLIKIPAQPLTQGSGSAASGKEEMTFYEELAKKPVKPAAKVTKSAVQETKMASAEKVKPREAAEKAAPLAETKKEVPAQKVPEAAPSGEKVWTVQVNAYPLERDAKSLAKKLKDKGYDAYVLPTSVKGKDWYRVRVGKLKTQEEAKALQETLKTKENFTKAITTSR
jgi:DedD protein